MMLFHTYGMITWLPEYLKVARGYTPGEVGTVSMLLGLVMIPGTFISGWLGDRVGAWGIGMIGIILCGACPAALVWIPGITLPAVLAVVCVLAFGICLLVVPLTSILSYLVPAKDNGKAVGLVHTTGYAGSIVSTYLGGYLLTVTGSYAWPFGLYVGRWWSVFSFCWLCTSTTSRRRRVEDWLRSKPRLCSAKVLYRLPEQESRFEVCFISG